uniref:Adaptor related protein complex 3 subunit sigma 2 n=1 Tax=Taeniopygia guttata TaxID=59729 RepID=A0A674H4W2_TAEGU
MINAILVFNNHGKPRLVRFYQHLAEEVQQQIIRDTFHLVLKRDDHICNFLECGSLFGGSDYKLIYRHYATLYFVFCVDSSESELGILDLIQVFVETLDKCFENVCELDLIFHMDKVGAGLGAVQSPHCWGWGWPGGCGHGRAHSGRDWDPVWEAFSPCPLEAALIVTCQGETRVLGCSEPWGCPCAPLAALLQLGRLWPGWGALPLLQAVAAQELTFYYSCQGKMGRNNGSVWNSKCWVNFGLSHSL